MGLRSVSRFRMCNPTRPSHPLRNIQARADRDTHPRFYLVRVGAGITSDRRPPAPRAPNRGIEMLIKFARFELEVRRDQVYLRVGSWDVFLSSWRPSVTP